MSILSAFLGCKEREGFSDSASPEVAPDKTHLRPQEHQISALYVDIISFCAPSTKFGLRF